MISQIIAFVLIRIKSPQILRCKRSVRPPPEKENHLKHTAVIRRIIDINRTIISLMINQDPVLKNLTCIQVQT